MINPFSTLRTWLRSTFTTTALAASDDEQRRAAPIVAAPPVAADSNNTISTVVTVDEVRAHITALRKMTESMLTRHTDFHSLSTMMLRGISTSLMALECVSTHRIHKFLHTGQRNLPPRLCGHSSIQEMLFELMPTDGQHLNIEHTAYVAATDGAAATDVQAITTWERIVVDTLYRALQTPMNRWDKEKLAGILQRQDGELRAFPNLPDDPSRIFREEAALRVLRAAGFRSGPWRVGYVKGETDLNRFIAANCFTVEGEKGFRVMCMVHLRLPHHLDASAAVTG